MATANERRDVCDADVVSTMVFVNAEREPELNLSGKCQGDTPLMDYVRRRIQRKQGLQLTLRRDRRVVLRMVRVDNCNWTSPMKDFKVGSVMCVLQSALVKF